MKETMQQPLWSPSTERIRASNMYRFMQEVNRSHKKNFSDYDSLYQWSVDNLEAFWAEFWQFAGIKASRGFDRVLDEATKMPGAQWFLGSRLNFAENLLRYRDDHTALIFRGEDRVRRTFSYRELYGAVAKVAEGLRLTGI
ncbi:acetyl-coenzyme A synthetase N-terminal domain-containing protein, partial [Thermodesulfobacteriota bacterium]